MMKKLRILGVLGALLTFAVELCGQNVAAPTGARVDMIDLTTLQISWQDNSDNENAFVIYTVENGALGTYVGAVPANETVVQLEGESGAIYQFAIFAVIISGDSTIVGQSSPGITNLVELAYYFYRFGFGGMVGQPLDALLELSGTPNEIQVSGLPSWANYDAGSRRFTGYPTEPGAFVFTVNAIYNDMTISDTFTFRILPAPSGPTQIKDLTRAELDVSLYGGAQEIDLGDYFTDPDTPAAVMLNFPDIGEVGIILYADAMPVTVSNFLAYTTAEAEKDSFDNTIIHRVIPEFIVQGGGYRPLGNIAFESVTDRAPIVNEPGLANLRGTLAMAKLGGNPDSATNEWFVNLGDNTENLDYQNEGFSVFGRVAGNGMTVFDTIAALPTGGYNTITVDGASRPGLLTDCPVKAESAPASLNQDILVKMSSARVVNSLSYEIVSMSHPSIASVTLSGDVLRIEPLTMGWSELTLAMTDLDGNRVERTYALTVSVDFASWTMEANSPEQETPLPVEESGPNDDPDGDGLPNLAEFAFAGNPMGASTGWPASSLYELGDAAYLSLSFSTYRRTTGLLLSLQARGTGATDWQTIWTSDDGNAHPLVIYCQEIEDFAYWKLRDNTPTSVSEGRLLRMLVNEQP